MSRKLYGRAVFREQWGLYERRAIAKAEKDLTGIRRSLGSLSVTELAEPFEMSLPAVSKHLRVLEHAGLITRRRSAQWRPCQLHAGPLKEVADWVEEYRRFWAESFDRLDDYLRELQAEEKKKGKRHDRKK